MSGVNKVIIVGRLTADVELRYAANGNAIANFNLATSEEWKDKTTGQKQEKAEFHRVVIYGKLAEIAGQYLSKGSQVYLEGKLQTRKWQDQNTGHDKYTTEVVVDGFNGQMQMLGGGQNNGQNQGHQQSQPNQQQGFVGGQNQGQNVQPQQNNQAKSFQQPPNDFDDEIVPF